MYKRQVYDAYLRGECYGYELYKNGELTDSCWGFVGSFDEAIKNIEMCIRDRYSSYSSGKFYVNVSADESVKEKTISEIAGLMR